MSKLELVEHLRGGDPAVAAAPFGVFLMRQFMLGIPDDLLEAARVDGAGELRIFWRIVLPLSAPALAALGDLHVPARLEQLPVAARRPDERGQVHAAGRARDLRARPVPGRLRPADGRLGRARRAGDRGLPAAPETLHPEHRDDRNQGMKGVLHDQTFTALVRRCRLAPRRARGAGARPSDTLQGLRRGHVALVRHDALPGHRAVADNVAADGVRARYTSPTNIGAYLWSTIAARDLGMISRARGAARSRRTLDDGRRRSSGTRQRPVLQLVRPADGREADDLAGRRRAPSTRSSRASTTAGSRPRS